MYRSHVAAVNHSHSPATSTSELITISEDEKILPEMLDDLIQENKLGKGGRAVQLPYAPYIYGCIAAMTTFAYGFNAGIISVALLAIKTYLGVDAGSYTNSFLVSAMLAGAVLGSLVPGWLGSDRIGRKQMLFFINSLLIVGAVGSSLCIEPISFIMCRVIVGVGIGMASIIPGLYITEMSPTSIRGLLGIMNQFAGFLGIITSYCTGLMYHDHQWKWMLVWGAVVAFVALISSVFVLPESPRWLVSRGRNHEALTVLSQIYGTENGHHFTDEFTKMHSSISRSDSTSSPDNNASKSSLSVKTILTIVALQFIQQAAGAGFVTYYSVSIFRKWDLSERQALLWTIFSALPQLFVFVLVALKAETWGRRRMLLSSEAAMIGVLLFLSYTSYFMKPTTDFDTFHAVLVFLGLAAHRVAYAIGLAPIPTVLIAEILPFSQRSRGLAMALTLNWTLNFVITSLIPLATGSSNSMGSVYLLMAIAIGFGFVYCYKNVQETRGVLLESIEKE